MRETCTWFYPQDEGYLMNLPRYESCRKCGRVRSADGSSDMKACLGLVKVVLR